FAAAPEVWDVTTPGDVTRLGVRVEGGRARVQVEALGGEREVVAFDPGASLRTFTGGTPVANQNLHGITTYPDYVIVIHESLRAAAERLAAHRVADGLETLIVPVDQILNEFGGGTMDMRAIRDYMKFLYDRADTEDRLPQHLLLFGDGHYDFRGIRSTSLPLLVPTYQTDEMLKRDQSFTSDDYFALLDDDEGIWASSNSSTSVSFERVDLGVGRLPVQTLTEADVLVDKILRYESSESLGDWRTRVTFLADDQYPNDFDSDLHVQNADAVATRIPDSTGVVVQKIYMPSYPEVTGATGRRRPGATDASRRAIEEGTLVWNYMGHGGPEGLADEGLFNQAVVDNLRNADRLPIFVTATCSFGKYDMADRKSVAEETLLLDGGGAVALFTTVRVVYTSAGTSGLNLGLNITLTREMLAREASGRPRRLGDIFASTKNTDIGAQFNNRKFNLLGDPAMRIGLPERTVRITHINGVPLPAGSAPQLRAFETARVQGEVLRLDGSPDPGFEGEVTLNVLDAEREVQLPIRRNTPGFYVVRTDPIYSGRASVRTGQFDATFLVPQDVSYSGQNARITTYALGSDATDGIGQSQEAIVAQDAGTRPNDNDGPMIRLFLDDTTFVSGGIARPDPTVIARLRDPSGINTVGAGVGHDLLLTIDGDPNQAVDVGRYYEGDLDTFTSGTVRFPLADLAPGPHTLSLTAWDGANNASTEVLEFVVADGADLLVENAYPYPNPTPGPSTFFFEHNQPPGTLARVQLRIYSLAGRPVRTMEMDGPLTGGLVRLDWDGFDDDADPLASGIYLYRLRVEIDGEDGARRVAERRDKLAVIR
ncbi:MAG: type IX secretion system sortase PorU, partial [Bacteroidota bacterium]